MIVAIINLSHPMPDETIDQIKERIMDRYDDVSVVVAYTIPVHLNMRENIISQLADLWDEEIDPILTSDADVFVIVFPDLSIVAAYITATIVQLELHTVYAVILHEDDVAELWRIA